MVLYKLAVVFTIQRTVKEGINQLKKKFSGLLIPNETNKQHHAQLPMQLIASPFNNISYVHPQNSNKTYEVQMYMYSAQHYVHRRLLMQITNQWGKTTNGVESNTNDFVQLAEDTRREAHSPSIGSWGLSGQLRNPLALCFSNLALNFGPKMARPTPFQDFSRERCGTSDPNGTLHNYYDASPA